MMKKVNCKHFNDFGYCNIHTRKFIGFLWETKIRCVEFDGFYVCKDAERSPRPSPPPPPTPRRNKDYENYI